MPVELPPPVDENGNITVNSLEGVTIPISSQDSLGAPVNISGVPHRFIVKGRIDKMLVAKPDNVQGKLLEITPEDTDKLGTSPRPFQVLDVTEPSSPITVWAGTIKRLAW